MLVSSLVWAEETREVAAGPEYAAGGWFRFLFGHGWWSPDIELLIGAGLTRTSWGFRNEPNRTVQTLRAAFATGQASGKLEYMGTLRPAASGLALNLHAYASGIERINFFGFGNDTPQETDRSRYKTDETAAYFSPSLLIEAGPHLEASFGAEVRYSRSPEADDSILGQTDPYGAGPFGSVGLRAGLTLDTRERLRQSGMGLTQDVLEPEGHARMSVRLRGLHVPRAWDVEEAYTGIDGEAAGYFGSPEAHVALRIGGRKLWGTYTWFDAAFIGGANARAFPRNRFAGDASLYGSAELRLWLGMLRNPIVPLRLGGFALVDAGRVWLEGEDSDTWHASHGGGVLLQPFGLPITAHATLATGDEGTRFYFGSGYSF